MTGKRIHVRSTKYDGSRHWEFDSVFVHEVGTLLITNNPAGQELSTPSGPWKTPWDTRNHFWSDRWYNVLRLEKPNGGGLEGFYCNVTTPAEFDGENVTVLVDSCELEHEIDAARADAAEAAAQQYLEKAAGDEDPERYQQYEVALERARTRAAVSQRKR